MNIKELRTKLKMTQKEFGEYLNIPQRTIQSWELGDRTPPEYVLELIKYKIKKERLGMLELFQMDHGEKTVLVRGNLKEIVEYLRNNENLINWVHDEDPEMELPNLEEVEDLQDLKYELEKIDLSWWKLGIEGKEIEKVGKWVVEETIGINIEEDRFNTKEEALEVADQIWGKWSLEKRKNNHLEAYYLEEIHHFVNGEVDYMTDFRKVYGENN